MTSQATGSDALLEECIIVARTHARLFRRWSILDLAAEVWRISVETGRPPHVVWRRAIDAYERETSHIPRTLRRSREKRGRPVPVVHTFGCFEDEDYGSDRDDPARIDPVDGLREFIAAIDFRPREAEILNLYGRGLDRGQIAASLGIRPTGVTSSLVKMRKRLGVAA